MILAVEGSRYCSTLFGGPSQTEPTDPRGGIQIAQRMAEANHEVEHLNQYANPLVSEAFAEDMLLFEHELIGFQNPDAHTCWTGKDVFINSTFHCIEADQCQDLN